MLTTERLQAMMADHESDRVENFPEQTDYRNPVVAEAMATLGYVNAFSRGVRRAQEALRRNGNPQAEFTFETSYVLATIRRKP